MALRAATADKRTAAAIGAASGSLLALAAVLSGCVQQRPAPTSQAPLPQTLNPNGGFFFSNDKEEGAKLVYGREGTDDVWLMMLCAPGRHEVEITDVEHGDAKPGLMLVLTSGRMQSPLPIKVEPNEDGDGSLAIARAPTSLPALEGFRRTGQISVQLGARRYVLTATGREKPAVARFFSACERK